MNIKNREIKMKQTFKKGLLITLMLAITGCSQTVPLQNSKEINEKNIVYEQQFQKEFGFSVKDLSNGYVKRVLAKLGTVLNGIKLVDFLMYALYKGASVSDLIKNELSSDPALKATVNGNADVVAKKASDANFRAFMGVIAPVSGIISTIAGTGTASTDSTAPNGDGGTAISATLKHPEAIFIDNSNNIIIADRDNYKIRKINSSGIISTIAGTGIASTSGSAANGDGGLATANGATLGYPGGVVVDNSTGIIFIADTYNHKIRKLTPNTGTNPLTYNISTIAGTGNAGNTGDNSAALSAKIDTPRTIAIDNSGNLYFPDPNANTIRKLIPNTGTNPLTYNISTIAGSLNNPWGVTVDGSGNVFISGGQKIQKLTPNTGTNPLTYNISTIAGTGTQGYSGDGAAATSANLNWPYGLSVDNSGNIFIAEQGSHSVRKLTPNSGTNPLTYNISTIAGGNSQGSTGDGQQATNAKLNYPYATAFDSFGNVFIADNSNNKIRKVNK